MAHSYESQYPSGVKVEPAIVQFFQNFYRISDDPNAHDEYVDMFTKDADFILASKASRGHEGKFPGLNVYLKAQPLTRFSSLQRSEPREAACGLL